MINIDELSLFIEFFSNKADTLCHTDGCCSPKPNISLHLSHLSHLDHTVLSPVAPAQSDQ